MVSFYEAMNRVMRPYYICAGSAEGGPLYDYGVCAKLEDLVYLYMDEGHICGSFNYLDFACDGEAVQGCMTITIMEDVFVPIVYTILYEKELNTCG